MYGRRGEQQGPATPNPRSSLEQGRPVTRRDQNRVVDIPEAIERIERYAAKGKDAFDWDDLLQDWIIHHLQIIGEADC